MAISLPLEALTQQGQQRTLPLDDDAIWHHHERSVHPFGPELPWLFHWIPHVRDRCRTDGRRVPLARPLPTWLHSSDQGSRRSPDSCSAAASRHGGPERSACSMRSLPFRLALYMRSSPAVISCCSDAGGRRNVTRPMLQETGRPSFVTSLASSRARRSMRARASRRPGLWHEDRELIAAETRDRVWSARGSASHGSLAGGSGRPRGARGSR